MANRRREGQPILSQSTLQDEAAHDAEPRQQDVAPLMLEHRDDGHLLFLLLGRLVLDLGG